MYANITGMSFEPEWRILYVRGYFWSPSPTREVRIMVNGEPVGEASLGWRFVDKRFFENRYQGFIFERRIPMTVGRGDVIEAHCVDEEGGGMVASEAIGDPPRTHQKDLAEWEKAQKGAPKAHKDAAGAKDAAEPKAAAPAGPAPEAPASPGWFDTKGKYLNPKKYWTALSTPEIRRDLLARFLGRPDPTAPAPTPAPEPQFPELAPPPWREQLIFVAVHNLDVEERKEKRLCFEKMDAALRQWGWRFFVVHHSQFELETGMDFVQMLEVDIPEEWRCDDWLDASGAREAVHEAVSLLYGHHADKKQASSWEACHRQVMREAMVFEYLVRRHKPFACILWHQWNSMAHMNRFICDLYGVPSMFAHEGFLADTLGVDSLGEMAESHPAVNAREFNSLPLCGRDLERADRYIRYMIDGNLDRKMQARVGSVGDLVRSIKEKTGRPVLFYAGVNDWQTGMLPVWWDRANLHSPHFVDTYDALDYLARVCEERDWYLLFKPHPNVPPRHGKMNTKRLVSLRHANILECVNEADVTLTLVSTVGYGARVHDRPVVMLGRNTLNGTDAVYEIEDPMDIGEVVERALRGEGADDMREAFRAHVARLLRYYLYPYSDRSMEVMGKTHTDAARSILKRTKPGRFV